MSHSLLDDVRQLSGEANELRDTQHQAAVDAVRTIERALREALQGVHLRGLANLSGDSRHVKLFTIACAKCGVVAAVTYRPATDRPALCHRCAGNLRSGKPFYGARLRAHPDKPLTWSSEARTVETPCLSTTGELVMALCETTADGVALDVVTRPLEDAEIRDTDAQDLLDALDAVLPKHVEKSGQAHERTDRAQKLYAEIDALLSGVEWEDES